VARTIVTGDIVRTALGVGMVVGVSGLGDLLAVELGENGSVVHVHVARVAVEGRPVVICDGE
jgi:hypothetical protein